MLRVTIKNNNMKTLKLLSLFLLIAGLTFTSCKKDEDTEPPKPNLTIKFPGGVTSIEFPAQNTIDVLIEFAAEVNIKRVYLSEPQPTGDPVERDLTDNMGPNGDELVLDKPNAVYYFKVTAAKLLGVMATNASVDYVFYVEDKEGNVVSAKFTVTKKAGTYLTKEVTIGELYHVTGDVSGAWDLEHDTYVALTSAPSTIFMTNTDAAGAAFTGGWKSNPANATKFVKTGSSFDYVNATEEAAIVAYNLGTPSASISAPAVNDLYVAMRMNVYYVIKIIEVDPTFSPGTGAGDPGVMKFHYKKKP